MGDEEQQGESMTLKVDEYFQSVQGEGLFSGTYSTFIRLRGCNAIKEHLECAEWCDTKYAWEKAPFIDGEGDPIELRTPIVWTSEDLLRYANDCPAPRIVITGGEPLLQRDDLGYFIERYSGKAYIGIETNGTIDRSKIPWKSKVWWTVSPKPPHYHIKPGPIDELKVIVPIGEVAVQNMELSIPYMEKQAKFCYFQPMDNNLDIAKMIVKTLLPRHPEWRLSMQLHKLLDIK